MHFLFQLKYTQTQIEKLKKTNVFNSTFHIWHVGAFATINGFRLGRLSSVPVEWNEINAAWGQTALLLSCLAKALGIESFQRYQIVPYGNYSYIKVKNNIQRSRPRIMVIFIAKIRSYDPKIYAAESW